MILVLTQYEADGSVEWEHIFPAQTYVGVFPASHQRDAFFVDGERHALREHGVLRGEGGGVEEV